MNEVPKTPEKPGGTLRRYAIIDPLVGRDLAYGEKAALLRELVDRHGVSVSTLKRSLVKFEQEGLDGLRRQARTDTGTSRALTDAMLEAAITLRKEQPKRSTRQIIRMLELEHDDWKGKIKRSTLDDQFRRLGLSRQALARDRTGRRSFAKTRRNLLWQTDMCKPRVWVPVGEKPKQAVLVAIIDDASRLIVGAEFFLSEEAWVVEATLRKAISTYGAPVALYLDNGAQFCAEQIESACRRLEVQHLRASVGEPCGKGKVERYFKTLQDSLVPELDLRSAPLTLVELNKLLRAWIAQHYHATEHSALGTTPAKRWENDPTPLRIIDPITLEGAFLLSENRTVDKTGLIRLDNRRYLVEKVDPQERVEVRYHPKQTDQVQIWYRGRFVQIAERYMIPSDSPRLRRREEAQAKPPTAVHRTYADQLVQAHEASLAKEREAILSGQAPPSQPAAFREGDLFNLLGQTLGRALSETDEAYAGRVWRSLGGLDRGITRTALLRAVSEWGRKRHLSQYMDAISHAHEQDRRKECDDRV